jgi:hypothetical protein
MRPLNSQSTQTAAILTLAEIKGALEAFDGGEINAFDALDAIVVEVEAYGAAARPANGLEAA